MADTETLDDLVRRVDPDRWLTTRFIADPAARADVIALYGLNYELARVAGGVSNALMGEIRLTWWREAMEEVAAGKAPRKHPNVEALAASGLDPNALAALSEARFIDLDEGPLKDEAAVMAYVDGTAGALAVLAARRLDPSANPHAVKGAARAWGLAGLWRLKSAGRSRLPESWTQADVKQRVEAQLKAARGEVRGLPVAAFPAVAPAALARPYVSGREMGELEKKARLTFAVATGRL
ncbi:phytoene synthase [Caulobacter segnis]|uniref:Phytoene synthase family protein n=2 Tax=Caulobacter segnis TaxID=88688 RepID=D5VIW4_CAUST|nr:squalene/phytoene synthase family protein [Caulobacter segnis]ADG09930.1 phytoene synthase family protein [Caulobacter segnis ATCC 21756]AVQ01686.1 phytoene synthase [Caulobacter segnis]